MTSINAVNWHRAGPRSDRAPRSIAPDAFGVMVATQIALSRTACVETCELEY